MDLNKINSHQELDHIKNTNKDLKGSPTNRFERKVFDNEKKYMNCIKPFKESKPRSREKSEESRSRKQSKSISKNESKLFDSQSQSKRREDLQELFKELISLKSQYKTLKSSYNNLIKQKLQYLEESNSKQQQLNKMLIQNHKLKKDIDKSRMQMSFMEHQIERIKRESLKLIEIQNFKNKKLEETLQQKQLMIMYLKKQLGKQNLVSNHKDLMLSSAPQFFQEKILFNNYQNQDISHNHQNNHYNHDIPLQIQNDIFFNPKVGTNPQLQMQKFMLTSISDNQEHQIKKISSQDSLTFSKDKSKSKSHHLNQSFEFGISPKMPNIIPFYKMPSPKQINFDKLVTPVQNEKNHSVKDNDQTMSFEKVDQSKQRIQYNLSKLKSNNTLQQISEQKRFQQSSESNILKNEKTMFKKKLKIFTDDKGFALNNGSADLLPLDSCSPQDKKRSTTGLRSRRKQKKIMNILEDNQQKSSVMKKKGINNTNTKRTLEQQHKTKKKKTIKNTVR